MTPRSQILRRGARTIAGSAMLVLAGCTMMGSSSGANTIGVSASLSAAAEVPPNASSATGSLQGSYNKDSKLLSWKLVYSGLSGPATMAHFHGPAMAGQNAGVVVPLTNPASAVESSATLTEAQAADLLAGKWYINVHTAANPGGEIRGQVLIK
ncbi:MAG TPA: CHRD domain-containing protein [Burkholderiaceae bacterium]